MISRNNTVNSKGSISPIDAPASLSPSVSRRSAAIPNRRGTKALYTVSTQSARGYSQETRLLDQSAGTSTIFSNNASDREIMWIGKEDEVVWLRDVNAGATEIWVGDAEDVAHTKDHCAGRIGAKATHLKVKRLYNENDDVAIAVACPSNQAGNLHNRKAGSPADELVTNAIWYSTLRRKAMKDSREKHYVSFPLRFINALRGTGLESPLPSNIGSIDDFDISSSGIAFLSKDTTGGSVNFPSINVYFLALKTFTEVTRPPPQIISVRGYEGRSSVPVFSPNGSSVAFLKKKHPIDRNDRNRVIVINNVREFCIQLPREDMHTAESEKQWHLTPYTVAWNDNGKELYVVAVDQGIRKLYKIPAALSSIRKDPEPITTDSTTAADVRHLRMIFSAPMDMSLIYPSA